tara:strand:- start:798 stop:989 length:192 start_codon:yes stop_codon:yes gene_type:complete
MKRRTKMKVGDLIKWKEDGTIGIILEIKKGWEDHPIARIRWADGEIIGRFYDLENLEPLNEPS